MSLDLLALADEAASLWDARYLHKIGERENAVFKIAAPEGHAALRLHRMGYQDEGAIQSELWWCAALAKAGVSVPAPLPAKDGLLLQRLSGGRLASAIAWVDGQPLGEAGQPFHQPLPWILDRHRDLGRLIASVHSATDKLILPKGFSRPHWDIDGLTGEAPFWGRFWDHPAATPEQAKTLRAARSYLHDHLTRYQENGADTGLIHADVLRENVLVNDSQLSLIDFDDSGVGFRLYDLGTVLSQNLYEPAYAQIRDALIEGYGATRPVTVALVELFTLARTCASVGWTMPRLAAGDPIHARHLARATMWAEHLMARG
jgi:Ser/Thr protein kinase RdoA (MazF antagonist)